MRYRLTLEWDVDEEEVAASRSCFIRDDFDSDEDYRLTLIESCTRDYGEKIALERV